MNENIVEGTLESFLVHAREGQLPNGWLYLAQSSPGLETRCLLVMEENPELDEKGFVKTAVQRGYAFEGLEADTIRAVVDSTRDFQDPPSEALLLEAFVWYLNSDSFLPEPGAPPPPSREAIQRELDRKFYDALGPEDAGSRCKSPGCMRGQLRLSAFCRIHHFEMIHHRRCPFTD
jgi:hypothetical protein